MIDAWDEWRPEVEEVIEVDPSTVLVMTHVRARGKGSGVPVEALQSRAAALEAIGSKATGRRAEAGIAPRLLPVRD
jgi:hypothetical protein